MVYYLFNWSFWGHDYVIRLLHVAVNIFSEFMSHEQGLDEGIKIASRTFVDKSLKTHLVNLLYYKSYYKINSFFQ